MDHWLFYATGGAAFAQIEVRQVDRAFTEFFDDVSSPRRWPSRPQQGRRVSSAAQTAGFSAAGVVCKTAGLLDAGSCMPFAENMTAGLEFRHVELGDETYRFKTDGTIFPGQTPVSVDNNQILAKITFLLGSRLHK